MKVNRALMVLNACGVIALGALCVVQWRFNARLNGKVIAAENAFREQAAKLAEATRALQGSSADLEDFRTQIIHAHTSLKETQDRLAEAEQQLQQATTARDQLQAQLAKWQATVTARDDRLQEASVQIQKLAADRNEAVTKYNDLAGKYNAAVSSLNVALDRIKQLTQTTNTSGSSSEKE